MKLVHHKSLDHNRWFALSLAEQMANIGSEVGRTITCKNKGNKEFAALAMERALELIDLTVENKKNPYRLKEILRLREVMVDWFYYDNEYRTTGDSLNRYFLAFNYLARIDR